MISVLISGGALAGCWSERNPCELWEGKLRRGEEAGAAVGQLAAGGCVGSRKVLLEHLADPGLGPDVLAALIALGRSPEAEAALGQALSRPDSVGVAARQVAEWKLTSAEPALRSALVDAALATHRDELLAAALTLLPAERWLEVLPAALEGQGPAADKALERALGVLAGLEPEGWAQATPEARAAVVAALAELVTARELPEARLERALEALGRAAPEVAPALPKVVERARGGHRLALLVLAGLGHPEAPKVARELAVRADVERSTRWLALALLTPGGSEDLAQAVATAPADAEVLLGLGFAVGPAAGPALAARREADKGGARAAAARAQAAALTAGELAGWESGLRAEASLLLRGLPDEPAVAGFLAVLRRCGDEPGCLGGALDELGARLQTFSADRSAALVAVTEARAQAEADTRADAARAKELAAGAGDAAAKAELDQIQARITAAYRRVDELVAKVDALTRLEAEALFALRRMLGAGGPVVGAAGRRVLERCVGPGCEELRTWAVSALLAAEAPTGRARFALVMGAR